MAIERVDQFIEFLAEDGLRTIVRLSAIQVISDSDPTADESYMTVANKTFLVRAPLDELRDVLMEDGRLRMAPYKASEA